MGMDYSLVQRIIDGLGKILDTKPGSPDEGTYVTEQQLADWIKGQTFVTGYYYNDAFYSDLAHTTLITPQANVLYADLGAYGLYAWDGAAYQPFTPDLSPYATKAEMQAADTNLQSQVDVLDHRVQNLEQAKGSYVVQNYKDGAITPSGKGNWAVVEGLRGVSRVANNLMQYSTGYSQTNQYAGMFTHVNNLEKVNIVSGHKYLFMFVQPAGCSLYRQNTTNLTLESGGTWSAPTVNTQRAFIATAGATAEETINSIVSKNETTATAYALSDMAICDLTLYFNGTIPSDADTIAEIQTNYPHLLIPSDYGTRIVDSSYSGVRAWARNVCDEVFEEGYISPYSGTNQPASGRIRGTNYYPVKPNTSYYFYCGSGTKLCLFAYDADKNFIGAYLGGSWTPSSSTTDIGNEIVATPANCYFLRIYCIGSYGGTYKDDICVSVSDSLNGTYTPYHAPSTLSLTYTGKSAGSVYDSCEPNVEVSGVARRRETERVGEQDLSQIAFTYNSTFASWRSDSAFSLAKPPASNDDVANIMLAGFVAIKGNDVASTAIMSIAMNIGGNIWVNNGSSSTPPSGTMRYELATPVETLSDPLIDNTLLTESGGRMATVQTGTVVDGSFDMGFITL